MRFCTLTIAALAAASCLASTASAQQCAGLTRVVSLDMTPAGAGMRMMVPLNINGVSKRMMLDTGAGISRLSPNTVTTLGLKPVESRITLLSNTGTSANARYATVDIAIGPINAKNYEALIEPNANGPWDGILAPDLMINYDIEMDFGGRKLNYFLASNCQERVVYWPASAVAVLPYRGWAAVTGDADMTLPVMLDGHEVIAKLNTGQVGNTLNADTARQLFSLTADSPGAVPQGTIGGQPDHKIFGWVFKKLEIGDIAINNLRVQVAPDLIGTKSQDMVEADSHVRRITDHFQPTLTIGMDVLSKLHLYVAIKEKKLYVTAAAAPAAAPAQPVAGR